MTLKLLHTSDWHAGRLWKGIHRLAELGDVLENLGDDAQRRKVDVLLMTGDVFDGGAPPAEAERLVFGFFRRLGRAGIRCVVIGGNHDHPTRLEAWGLLAELVGVTVVGRPRAARDGGVIRLAGADGTPLCIAAIPFAPARALLTASEATDDDEVAHRTYAWRFGALVRTLSAQFAQDSVNILLAHTHLEGAVLARSERAVHVGADWAATADAIPAAAHYVALGHIHKPQRVDTAPSPTFYAGSPMQLDFGEAGELKTYNVLEVSPAGIHALEHVAYQGARPLTDVRMTMAMLEQEAQKLRHSGWLRVTVPLDGPQPDINGRVRRLLPNAVTVEVELPDSRPPPLVATGGLSPGQLYAEYVRLTRQEEANPTLAAAFAQLHADAQE